MSAFVNAGFRTMGFDVDQTKVDKLTAGESYIKHIDAGFISQLIGEGKFEPTADLRHAEVEIDVGVAEFGEHPAPSLVPGSADEPFVARVEQRKNVRVLQVCGGLDLGEESVGPDDRGQLGFEDLHRDVPVVLLVPGEVDGGHAAFAYFPLYLVVALEGGVQTLDELTQRLSSPRASRSSVNQFVTMT